MTAKIIDGKLVAQKIQDEIKKEVEAQVAKGILPPGLAVILVGEDPASQIYVRNKKSACAKVGFYTEEYILPATTKEEDLRKLIAKLNENNKIHGILVQVPLPQGLNEKNILEFISPEKDVDCFHPVNVGNLFLGIPRFLPCTPAGIMELLKSENIDLKGKRAVIVGRSNIVGKPMAILLLSEHATVTMCHSRTVNLAEVCRQAQILVVAIGKARFITADMVSPGAVVIDIGQNRLEDKLVGDVDFEKVKEVASLITPVPGGVGPMTITMLLKNTLHAAKMTQKF